MRFVASTFLSVAILAFVTQSVSAGSAKNVDEVNQESNVLLKRNSRMYNIGAFGVNNASNTNVKDNNIELKTAMFNCRNGIIEPKDCVDLFGPDYRCKLGIAAKEDC
jgi:hypothetical protein